MPSTMPFEAAFILVFNDIYYDNDIYFIYVSQKKKFHIEGQKCLKYKKSLPSRSSPKRHTIHFAVLSQCAILSVQQTIELFAAFKTYLVAMATSSSKYHYQIKKTKTKNRPPYMRSDDSAMILPDFTRKLFCTLGP